MISFNEVRQFLNDMTFVKATDFARKIKPRHKKKKRKKKRKKKK